MSVAIKVENLGKAYQLGEIGTGTISRDLERWYARIRGKEDPYLRIGDSVNYSSDLVWSLKDLNFEVKKGDAVGVIGRNGAGKSTLLKLLSKITAPTTGSIFGTGKIASLLEVGTGFHPELTGKENIYLNGAILGMRKHEISKRFDEIVEFAGVSRYINTPVKRYSSGMYVRLAFAVAAHLESEILIVDEVLAVGDAEFQKKCLGKMSEISHGQGRSVLFVSHNMSSIQSLCSTGLVLKNGELNYFGEIEKAIENYTQQTLLHDKTNIQRSGIGNILIKNVSIESEPLTLRDLEIKLDLEKIDQTTKIIEAGISIWTLNDTRLISISTDFTGGINSNSNSMTCLIRKLPLIEGEYKVNAFIRSTIGIEDYLTDIVRLKIENSDYYGHGKTVHPEWGIMAVEHLWEYKI